MSPSITPMRSERPSSSRVLRRSTVFPAPGDDMRLTAHTPDSAKRRPLSSATRSFSESRFSRIVTLV